MSTLSLQFLILLERNHQGLGNELIEQSSETGQGRVACRERLGGLLKHYYREAA